MTYPVSFIIAAALSFVFLFAPSGVSVAGDSPAVRIGAFYNVSGAMGSIDGPALKGAKLAAKLANARGGVLGGRPVEIEAFDTKTDLKLAASLARIAAGTAMTAATGYGDSDFVLAAAPPFQAKGIPFVTSGATDPTLPGRIGNKLFLAAFGDDDQAAAMAEYAYYRLKCRKAAIWTDGPRILPGPSPGSSKHVSPPLAAPSLRRADSRRGIPIFPASWRVSGALSPRRNASSPRAFLVRRALSSKA